MTQPSPRAAVLAGAICVALSVFAWLGAAYWEDRVARAAFETDAAQGFLILRSGLGECEDMLFAYHAFISQTDKAIGQQKIEDFAAPLLARHRGIYGFAWVQHVGGSERRDFEADLARDGTAAPGIWRFTSEGRRIALPEQDEYFAIRYVTPAFNRQDSVGFDLGSDRQRLAALEQARDSGEPAVSDTVNMIAGPNEPGVIIVKPVYAGNTHPATIEERRRALIGFALGTFRLADTILDIIGHDAMPLGIDVYLYDDHDDIDRTPLAVFPSRRAPAAAGAPLLSVASSGLHWSSTLRFGDRPWRAVMVPAADPRLGLWSPRALGVLIACLFFTGLGALYARSNRRYVRQIEHLGLRLRTIFDGVQVMIWDEDLSEVWTALEQHRAQGMRDLRQHFRLNPEELWRLKGKVRVNAINAAALSVLGGDKSEERGALAGPELDEVFIEQVVGIFERLDKVHVETSLHLPSGGTRIGVLTMTVPRDRDDASHVIVSLVDVTDRKAAEARVTYLAQHDVVTGLPNRAMFQDRLNEFLERARRSAKPFAVHYVDIDHFKDINDTLGHPVGDELLKEIGAQLGRMIRATDMVARLGGDEFAVLQADVGTPDLVALFAEKLRGVIAQPFTIDGHQIVATASIGVALCNVSTDDAASIMRHADLALYRAKEEGRNTYSFHTDELERSVRERVELGIELRSAIGGGELFLEYQPQIDAARNTIIGFEALVRWRSPTRGLVPPSTIIPVAETTGLIVELGTWVLRETLRQGKAWLDAGYPPIILAVNLSGVEMRAIDFETVVLREIEASGYPPHLIELEITESVFFETSRIHHDALKRLRDAGVRFAIDDFGTGYSSLEYLLRFRVDRLKIAQTFMRDVTTDPNAAVIVRAAIGLAHDLGIEVIAEGAETAEQVEFLRREDCPYVQGYYFSRPLAAADAEKLLRHGASVSDLSRAA